VLAGVEDLPEQIAGGGEVAAVAEVVRDRDIGSLARSADFGDSSSRGHRKHASRGDGRHADVKPSNTTVDGLHRVHRCRTQYAAVGASEQCVAELDSGHPLAHTS
jgi:hypothetical protein